MRYRSSRDLVHFRDGSGDRHRFVPFSC
jgi:hypothetical protein